MTEPTTAIETADSVFGKYNGVAITHLPEDLYIPPDALQVYLEAFEGPLDLLLYLIRKSNVDILNIPIAEITRQYLVYVELMKVLHLELAAEYLVMAAMLAEIKSRLLLPRHADAPEEEEDPRAALIRRLQEYERIKDAAERLESMPRLGRDFFNVALPLPPVVAKTTPMELDLSELLDAFIAVLKRSDIMATHKVEKEALSVRERMSHVLDLINREKFIPFQACFDPEEGRMGVVVSFIAMLELLRLGLIDIVQSEPFSPIHIRAVFSSEDEEMAVVEQTALESVDEYGAAE